jgi:hypothetical protein
MSFFLVLVGVLQSVTTATQANTEIISPTQVQGAKPRIAILPLVAKRIAPDVVAVLDELLANAADRSGRFDVMTTTDINAMLGMERMKDVAGCNDVSCAVQIAGALNVDRLLTGTVSGLGGEMFVSLRMIDARAMKVTARAEQRSPEQERAYASAIEGALTQLLTQDSSLADAGQSEHFRAWPAWTTMGLGVVAMGIGATFEAVASSENSQAKKGTPTLDSGVTLTTSSALQSGKSAKSHSELAALFAVGGAVLAASGGLWLYFGSSRSAPPAMAFGPAVGPGSAGLAVLGHF